MNSRIKPIGYPANYLPRYFESAWAGLLVMTLVLAGCAGTPDVQESKPAPSSEAPVKPPAETGRVGLADTEWKAASILGKPAGSADSTLAFGPDGRAVGNAGCNGYQGDVTLDGNTIVFGLLATTRMMCPPPINGQETVFLEALGLARSWKMAGNKLDLLDESDAVVLSLTRQ